MFHTIRSSILGRMTYLEQIDARDRNDGTPRMQRLRQIPPETGKFIALLAASAPEGTLLEIGTSAGYSTLWLALACEALGRSITTFEVLPDKVQLAREAFQVAQVEPCVRLVEGDARDYIAQYHTIAYCFLDAEKEIYGAIYGVVVPRLAKGGILVADNAINRQEALQPFLDRALADDRVDALICPLGGYDFKLRGTCRGSQDYCSEWREGKVLGGTTAFGCEVQVKHSVPFQISKRSFLDEGPVCISLALHFMLDLAFVRGYNSFTGIGSVRSEAYR